MVGDCLPECAGGLVVRGQLAVSGSGSFRHVGSRSQTLVVKLLVSAFNLLCLLSRHFSLTGLGVSSRVTLCFILFQSSVSVDQFTVLASSRMRVFYYLLYWLLFKLFYKVCERRRAGFI